MTALRLELTIDDEQTAPAWTAAMALYLRGVAERIERATGPIEITAEWSRLADWPGMSGGDRR